MAYSYTAFTGNGSTTQYAVAFPYIRREHVAVTVAGVPSTFTWVNNSLIQMDAAPANGAAVRVYRTTPIDAPLVDFADGSTLVAADLDTNSRQSIYIQQELDDAQADNLPNVIPNGNKGDITTSVGGTVWAINTGAVTEAKINNGAVTSAKILDGTIVNADVNASAGIAATKLAFTQSGTGATARTVDSKLKDVVSAKDFGAVGDGATDDTAAIQAALSTTAKVVQLGQGSTYLVTAALASSVSDRVIVGDGSTITTNGSILAANAVLTLSGARSKALNLRLTGIAGTTLCSAIQLTSGDSCEVSGCHISDFTNGAGIVATSSATKHVIANNHLNNCNPVSFGGLQYGSIHCNADKTLISGNRIANADLTGISTFAGKYLTIKSNYIEGKSGSATAGGILLDGYTVGCVIDSNTINGCKVEGIQIAGSVSGYGAQSRDHIISNNCILEAEYSGITLYGADADAVVNVNITGNQIKSLFTINRGIELNRCSGVNITGNYVYGYATGIQVPNAAPNVTVNSNVFEAQLTYGVLAHGRYWTVSENRIIGRAGGTTTGIVFNGSAVAGDQLISGNFIQNCLKGIDGTFSTAQPTHVRGNRFNANTTDFTYSGDSPNSSSGNAFNDILSGTFTLAGGIAAVFNSNIRANDKINIWFLNWGAGSQATVGQQQITEISAGNRFVVESTKAIDVSQLAYEIVR